MGESSLLMRRALTFQGGENRVNISDFFKMSLSTEVQRKKKKGNLLEAKHFLANSSML